jgi:alkylhydroperoxidase family enzyme
MMRLNQTRRGSTAARIDRPQQTQGEFRMSWIRTVPESEAGGLLADIYRESRAKFGRVINLVKIQSLRPETMALGRQLYRHLMDSPGGLTKLQRALIATVVSKVNGCHY